MNVLITGANSNLAKEFIKHLLNSYKKKPFYCYGTTRLGKPIKDFRKIFKIDFRKNNFAKIEIKFDIVIHIASLVPSNSEIKKNYKKTNYHNPYIFFKGLKYNKNSIFLNISSSSVYNDISKIKIFENSKKIRKNGYGLSKLYFEKSISKFFKNKNVSVISTRVPCLIIPNTSNNFLAKWKKAINSDQLIELKNPNSIFNAAIDGKSIIEFIINLKKTNINDSINVASKSNMTIKEVAELMAKKLNKKLKYKIAETQRPSQIIVTKKAEKLGFICPEISDIIKTYIIN
jgi:nucleoside-diphosphate-sugar epimerase